MYVESTEHYQPIQQRFDPHGVFGKLAAAEILVQYQFAAHPLIRLLIFTVHIQYGIDKHIFRHVVMRLVESVTAHVLIESIEPSNLTIGVLKVVPINVYLHTVFQSRCFDHGKKSTHDQTCVISDILVDQTVGIACRCYGGYLMVALFLQLLQKIRINKIFMYGNVFRPQRM
jgi:hypothetical protein